MAATSERGTPSTDPSKRTRGQSTDLECSVLQYVKNNKEADNDWFRLESNPEGTRWWGKAWTIQDMLRYEFDIEFDVNRCECSTSSTRTKFRLDSRHLSDDRTGNRHSRSRRQNGEDVSVS